MEGPPHIAWQPTAGASRGTEVSVVGAGGTQGGTACPSAQDRPAGREWYSSAATCKTSPTRDEACEPRFSSDAREVIFACVGMRVLIALRGGHLGNVPVV